VANAETTSENAETTSKNAETTSKDAETTSENAETTSENAETTSENAETTSENAETTSENAETTSGNAETTSENAETTSENAEMTSENAEATAENAEMTSKNAEMTSKNAEMTSENAEMTSENAEATAENAEATAENAETTAENAETTAENAETTAENAEVSIEPGRAPFSNATAPVISLSLSAQVVRVSIQPHPCFKSDAPPAPPNPPFSGKFADPPLASSLQRPPPPHVRRSTSGRICMDTQSLIRDTLPDQGFHIIGQLGLRALNLGTTHKTVIDERIPGVLDALALNLDTLGVAIPGVFQTRHESMVATAEQNARIRQGYSLVRAVRRMVTKARAPEEIRKAYGVGQKVQPTMYSSVAAALQGIVGRANAEPAEAAALGLGPANVADITAFLASLSDIGKAQEQKRMAAPLSTKERNMVAHRILQAVGLISGAGMIAFLNNPTTYASFDALRVSSKKQPAKKGAPAKAPTTAPASAAPVPAAESAPEPSPAPLVDTASAPPASPVTESVSPPSTSPGSQTPIASP
jgi:hypothetical protein